MPAADEDDRSLKALDLTGVLDTVLDWRHRGIPSRMVGARVADAGDAGRFNVLRGDVALPCAVLKASAIAHNSAWMRRFVEHHDARIAPHGKTTMAPQLFQQQIDDGAWGLTAATLHQVRIYRHFGVERIVLANQVTCDEDLDTVWRMVNADPGLDFYFLVDSVAGLELIRRGARRHPHRRPLQLLVEVGLPGGRTGFREPDDALALCRQIARLPDVAVLAGIEAFEGIVTTRDPASNAEVVRGLMRKIGDVATAARREDLFGIERPLLTAGGSALFDIVAGELAAIAARGRFALVLRSGCYLTHDSHHYEVYARAMRERGLGIEGLEDGLRPALEVCARIQSVPERSRAIASLGKRDISFDIDLPRALWIKGAGDAAPRALSPSALKVVGLNDHHAYLDLDGSTPCQLGDIVGFGVSHPCTTFDKWQVLLRVDDGYDVIEPILTYF